MVLLLNGKRLTLAPHRAKWLSIIHDNFDSTLKLELFEKNNV